MFDLGLGSLHEMSTALPVQRDVSKITASYVFGKCQHPGILVVLSSMVAARTDADAWSHLGEQIDLDVEFWDLSFHGHFNMEQALPEVDDRTLMEVFAGKVVVFMQQEFDVSGSTPPVPCSTLDYLVLEQYQRACIDASVRFMVCFEDRGKSSGALDYRYLSLPHLSGVAAMESSSPEVFKSALKAKPNEFAPIGTETRVRVPPRMLTLKSVQTIAIAARRSLNAHLERAYPHRHYFVTLNEESTTDAKTYGEIVVRRGLNRVTHNAMHDVNLRGGPLFFSLGMSPASVQQFFCGIHDETLLLAFHFVLGRVGEPPTSGVDLGIAEAVKAAVLKRLMVEHAELRAGTVKRKGMPLFMTRFAASFQVSDLGEAPKEFVLDLVVKWRAYDAFHNTYLKTMTRTNTTHQTSAKAWKQLMGVAFQSSLKLATKELKARETAHKRNTVTLARKVSGVGGHSAHYAEAIGASFTVQDVASVLPMPLLDSVTTENAYQSLFQAYVKAELTRVKLEKEHFKALMALTSDGEVVIADESEKVKAGGEDSDVALAVAVYGGEEEEEGTPL
jgi:hypothetical protein